MGLLSTIRKIERIASRQNEDTNVGDYVSEASEETYGGVPLSDLSDLAGGIYRGVEAIVNSGLLEFVFTSRSGKTKRRVQYDIDEDGNLEKLSNNYHENEYYNPGDEFLKEANERFTFNKDE